MNERKISRIVPELVGQDAPINSLEQFRHVKQQVAQEGKIGLPGATDLEQSWAQGVKEGTYKLNQ